MSELQVAPDRFDRMSIVVSMWLTCSTGEPVYVVAAGGIFDGRGLAMALCFGAQAAWVGTRFVCAKEAGATARHQKAIIKVKLLQLLR